jgi:chromatin remodeling complex protein RSC6
MLDPKKGAAKKSGEGKSQTKGAAQGGLARPVKPSDELAVITGTDPLPRSEVVSKMWDYIKKNNLQNPENKREILADDKLEKVFGTKKVTMFEMNKHLSRHLS